MKRIFFYVFIVIPALLNAQSQNPPSLKWKQVNTEHFRVIFPTGIDDYAKETAILLDSFYVADTKIFIDNHPKKIDILLYNQSVVSNAYAALAPRRMVWYLTPPYSPYLTLSPWNKVLGIHEFRHVTQYAKMNDGFTLLASKVFGQYGQAMMNGWAFPNWFFEGDAVFNETKYTNSGRGRMPSFSLPLRTIYLNDQKISYEKAFFRSYRTYYPNHYYLGYHMVTYINRHYGEDIWNKIIYRTSLYSYWPYSFERSVKKYTGFNVRKTYKKTFAELDSIWNQQLAAIDTTPALIVNKRKRTWTNYFDPQFISDDTLLVLKSGFDENTALYYLLPNKKEKKIREINGENISYAKNMVVWTRYSENIRYAEQSFSDIVIFNLKTKKLKQITKNGKFLTAEISHNADKIVAVRYSTNLIPEIVILDMNGEEIFSYKGKMSEYFMMPTWTTDDKNIIFLHSDANGESLLMLNIDDNTLKTLIPAQWVKFDKPFCYSHYVFFNYDYSGITNIYALDLNNSQIFQVTSRLFGAIQAIVDKDSQNIYFTDYNLKALDIAKMPYNPDAWIPLDEVKQNTVDYFKSPKTETTLKNIDVKFASDQDSNLQVSDYKPIKHLFNVHSWLPFNIITEAAGLTIISDDVMNTTSIMLGLGTLPQANIFTFDANISYKKYFPVFTLGFTYGQKGVILDSLKDDSPNANIFGYDSIANWSETNLYFSTSLPLDFSKGIYYRPMNLSISATYAKLAHISDLVINSFTTNQTLKLSANFSFLNRKFMNFRDVAPRWGQYINAGYSFIPEISNIQGNMWFVQGELYLPGLLKHHSIILYAGMQNNTPNTDGYYPFYANISLPRGLDPTPYINITKFSVDYEFPLFYPDLNIPYLLYIKRLRADLFYDYAIVNDGIINTLKKTYGIDLVFDFNILRLNYISFNAGFRITAIDNNKIVVQGLFLDIPF